MTKNTKPKRPGAPHRLPISTRVLRQRAVAAGELDARYDLQAVEIPIPTSMRLAQADGRLAADARFWRVGACTTMLETIDGQRHMAISHPQRFPRWEEVVSARYGCLADAQLTMVCMLPPQGPATGDRTMHLWEIKVRGRGKVALPPGAVV